MIWHNASANEVLQELSVDANKGLSNGEVELRTEQYGQNVISKIQKPTFMSRFLSQIKNKTVIFLIITAVVSFIVSLVYDKVNAFSSLLIILIVVINALVSAYQLCLSDDTLESIKQITNPEVSVLRDGILKTVGSVGLVPGDIILLSEGDYISADARIVESNEFRCNESVLTGVEVPIEKSADNVFENITPLEKRANMVYSGTSVAHGTAKAVVVSTGLSSEIGRTSAIMQQSGDDRLPIENKLENLGRIINLAVLVICIFVFALGIYQNFNTENFASMSVDMLLNAVALGIATIPEGLPAITTIVVAVGMHRILKEKITLKDPSAAELLGKTEVICCDKTGVFTRNKMELAKVFDGKKLSDVKQDEFDDAARLVLKLAAVCSTLDNDATEQAIKNANLTFNSMSDIDVNALFPHITEIPFDSERKTMTVITMINEQPFAVVKGAPEVVVPNCIDCSTEEILKLNESLANDSYRNVCIALRKLDSIPTNPTADDIEKNLAFVGILAIDDPPREGVVDEIATCDNAGIRTIMITGDNIGTAKAVARRIGILKDGTLAITGAELADMTDEELAQSIDRYSVFARISPADKVRIVKAWQSKKKIVAITGDSVQDADALATADIGCAIGRYGADVAKGNADIIISNNRFDSIVNAIRQSRGLFANIRKSIHYLFSCNLAEMLSFIVGMLIFKNPVVSAVGLLWINLLTDSAPAISLSMENAESRFMRKDFNINFGKLLNPGRILFILIEAAYMTLAPILAYSIGNDFGDGITATTLAFATISFAELFHCFNIKSDGTVFSKNTFSNNFMNVSVGAAFVITLFLIFTPAGSLFGLCRLKFLDFLITFALGLGIVPLSEILKLAMKNK